MKKSQIVTISVIVLVLIAAGVTWFIYQKPDKSPQDNKNTANSQDNSNNTVSKPKKSETPVKLTVDTAIEKLKAAGLEVGKKQGAYYQIIGASNGDKVDVNGTNVELYEFSDSKALAAAKPQMEDESSTTFTLGNFLVLIHSTDKSVTNPVEMAIK